MFPCLHILVKTSAKFVRFLKQVKTLVDLCLRIWVICSPLLPNVRLGFLQAMKARRTCFYLLNVDCRLGFYSAFVFIYFLSSSGNEIDSVNDNYNERKVLLAFLKNNTEYC